MKKHFLVRHAHRPLDDWSHGVSITGEGELAAVALGVTLKQEGIELVSSSPIKRCKQTAIRLLQGMEKEIPIIEEELIGVPGALITDQAAASRAFQKHAWYTVADLLLEGAGLDGFGDVDTACKGILQHLLSHSQTSLSVSHDFYIALLAGWMFEQRCAPNLVPGFLEGLILYVEEGVVTAEYKGMKITHRKDL